MIIALDTETTGKDLYHGAKPFFVTTCDDTDTQRFWEWAVNPLTREPQVDPDDIAEIQELIDSADALVFQNCKFDIAAMGTIGIKWTNDHWLKTYDTLLAAHLLASNHPHGLTALAVQYLGINIEPVEDALEKACQEARRWARSHKPEWLIAKEGLPMMPSCKGSTKAKEERSWAYDMWLPRAVAVDQEYDPDHSYWSVLPAYSNTDSAVTIKVWQQQKLQMEERKLWDIYQARRKILPILLGMEKRGLTINGNNLEELSRRYKMESAEAETICLNIAAEYDYPLEMPKGASPNNSLRTFMYDVIGVEPVYDKKSKSDAPTLNKGAMNQYEATYPASTMPGTFIRTLKGKRSRDTAVAYMEGYKRFWLPLRFKDPKQKWYLLHPKLNPTGTDTLRMSSNDPNEQNISKKEDFNLRYCFGPAPGREWYSKDAKNLELRIPAYESREKIMMDLFDRPNDPPYYGSYHMLIFDILHPEKFAKYGMKCKDIYASTWYQNTKNGNFAVTYGAIEESGTADRAYGIPGAQARIKSTLKSMAALNQKYIAIANKQGYVETLPDRTVDPDRGYPLLCTRSFRGQIKPTVPFNYHTQGTACWWMMQAMVLIEEFYEFLNRGGVFAGKKWPGGYYMVMNVHDEVVSDMPAGKGRPGIPADKPWMYNLPIVEHVRKLMESCGDNIGIKTPVDVEYHETSWDKGITIKGMTV